ncbi:MAG: hypothetical protein IJT97_00565 [Bacteroidaceae bacterium]|nr:hypothetical protein [Bacteroidaceae bacterium]
MRSFLKHIILFSFCILVPLIAAEIYVENLPNPSRDKHQWMQQHSRSVRTLILGSSHTFYGVNPNLFPDTAFSLAQVAQTYRYDDYLLKHYPMPQLRTVILPFSYFSLYEDFERMPRERYNAIRYRLYMDCDIHPRIGYYGFEFSSIDALTEKLKTLWRPARTTWDKLGWGTDFTWASRESDWDNGAAAAANNTYADTTLVPLNIAFLDDIMDYCTSRGVRLLFVTTPLSPQFIAHQLPEQVNRNRRVLNQLLHRHPDVIYIDYSQDTLFTEHDFYDSHHLNEYGAAKLTREIISRANL